MTGVPVFVSLMTFALLCLAIPSCSKKTVLPEARAKAKTSPVPSKPQPSPHRSSDVEKQAPLPEDSVKEKESGPPVRETPETRDAARRAAMEEFKKFNSSSKPAR